MTISISHLFLIPDNSNWSSLIRTYNDRFMFYMMTELLWKSYNTHQYLSISRFIRIMEGLFCFFLKKLIYRQSKQAWTSVIILNIQKRGFLMFSGGKEIKHWTIKSVNNQQNLTFIFFLIGRHNGRNLPDMLCKEGVFKNSQNSQNSQEYSCVRVFFK